MQSAPSQPAPQFNATGVSTDQTKSNVNTAISNAILNNTNQVTPTGTLSYSQTGGQYDYNGNFIPSFTATQTLSPELQGLYDKTLGIAGTTLGQVGNAVGTPMDFSGLAKLPTDQTAFRNQAYDALTARSNEDLGRARTADQVQLANQGIQPGSEAYRRAMEGFDRATVDASNQAFLQAGNLAGQNLQQAQTLRNQGIAETQAIRNQPIQDYQALLGLSGGITPQNFVTTPQNAVAPTDVTAPQIAASQMQYGAYQNAVNNAQRSNQALMNGLFNLGGSALGGFALGGFKV